MTDHWHNHSAEQSIEKLKSDSNHGLSNAAAADRLKEYGENVLQEGSHVSIPVLLFRQLKNPLLIILLIGAGVSLYAEHPVDAIAIGVIVVINALIGFVQEYKAQKSMDALKEMAAPQAMTLRDGKWASIPAHDLVPGDILKLETGDVVPADLRVIESVRLQADEAALTGESEPVDKQSTELAMPNLPLGDRINMAYMSTLVTAGNGIGLVTATGMATEVGKIAELLAASEEPQTPLQKRISELSTILIGAALGIVAIIIGIGLLQGMDLLEMVNTGISLSVAAIPEGLPTVVTIVLTMGSQRMARSNALARQLASVETLGSTSVICSDKTGTLTQNKMQLLSIWAGGTGYDIGGADHTDDIYRNTAGDTVKAADESDLTHALMIAILCNEATLIEEDGELKVRGNPTEGALKIAAHKAGLSSEDLIQRGYEILERYPFDSTRKMMSVMVKRPDQSIVLFTKGAPDVLLSKARLARLNAEEKTLDAVGKTEIEATIAAYGERALRTLAMAYRELDADQRSAALDELEQDFVLQGLCGIMDPPRPEVIDAIAECSSAGIRTIMITGDHAATAQAIAEQIGIKRGDEIVMTGAELDQISDEELQTIVPNAAVFARVSPEHKMRIVKALQANQEVVAMTGDGVNDAPALRNADIGVAMGITGTAVAKEASALVLLDDNFATIVAAVKEGRRIYDNIRKFIRQALTANVAEVSVILFAFLMMEDDPLLPITALMILWINLVSDGLPALALGVDPMEADLMKRQPRPRTESFFAGNLGARIVIRGLALGWLAWFIFDRALDGGLDLAYAETMAFTTLIFAQLWHIFDARSFTTLYQKNPFNNGYLLLAVFSSGLLSVAMIYTPFGNLALGTVPLSLRHLFMLLFLSSLPTFGLSAIKAVFRIRFL
jgi:Ca2+-transporting ATPase